MNKSTLILFITIAVFSFLQIDCKKEVPPQIIIPPVPTNCEYPAGNRNFIWRLDTVAWFPSTIAGVWAFSDTDTYVIGTIIDGKPPYNSRMGRHWNGKVWEDNIHGTLGSDITVIPRNDLTGDDHLLIAVGFHAVPGHEYAGIAEFNNNTKQWRSYQLSTEGELRSVWTDSKGYFIAVGDNGMVYTKDGYTSEWEYQKAPTEFNLYRLTGVSKDEIYISGYENLASGENYRQCWKFYKNSWTKFYDTKDTTNTVLAISRIDSPSGIGVSRCTITDSLKFYVIGNDSYLFESVGQTMAFKKTNLQDLGLPLKINSRTGININLFSPNDYWVIGTRYNFYHWNGINFQKMIVPGLPNDDLQFGWQPRFVKTSSGKVFLPTEVSSQVYLVAQGTP